MLGATKRHLSNTIEIHAFTKKSYIRGLNYTIMQFMTNVTSVQSIHISSQECPELLVFLNNFPSLKPAEVQLLIDNTSVHLFPKGTTLLREGQVATQCYMVLKGCVREYYLVDGREISTAFFTEGQPVAALASASKQVPSKHYFVCAEDCLLTVSNQDMEREMCRLIPRLESIIRREVEINAGKERDEFARFVTSSPEERYLYLQETRPDLLHRIPQHQIASYLGVTPESLSRIRKRVAQKAKNQSKK